MQTILYEQNAGVATITLNRPAAKNALDLVMRDELAQVVAGLRRNDEVRALVLTGAGGAFCAGGDLRSIAQAPADVAAWRSRMQDSHAWFSQLLTLDKPVVAAVDGPAYGAGFGLALAADFVIASPRARFCLSFMRVGLVPDYATFYTLPRVVGVQRAKELMLSAREVGADEAKQLGIAMEIVPAEGLLARAQALAASFNGASPLAVSLVKRACSAAPGADLATMLAIEADAQALAASTQAHRDAVARFLDKQPPAFQWPAQPGAEKS
jgi:2-(1,2-epoxy-1,2-dihydrophenyl)acetyl-CoA isomerase